MDSLFVCTYCRPILNSNNIPNRCVLNGLELDEVPVELSGLDALSKQLIQRAKAFQTVVRLGTYTGKVPTYNSLKACDGAMFFLPLPFEKAVQTLEEIGSSSSSVDLPPPELYIIINGKPSKQKVMWRSLVDINAIKAAVQKLKEVNWLYKAVNEDRFDEVENEVVDSTTSSMLVKATREDISAFQYYTIRTLNEKLSNSSDMQFKLMNVTEKPLYNRQKYLDVMCFTVLYPSGRFGEHHERAVRI